MKIQKKILSILILSLLSCNGKEKKQEAESKSELIIKSETEIKSQSKLEDDYSKSVELFAQDVLKENIKVHLFDLTNSKKPKHLKIFQSNGLRKLVAYSDKNYPKKTEPNHYEDFILFVATYNNTENAKNIFDQIKSDSKKTGLLSDLKNLNKTDYNKAIALIIGIKPGGMIVQKGKQVISLVETCQKTPIGGNWVDYEQKLLSHIIDNENEIEILNSDCGKMTNYIVERRKASR